MAMIVKFFEGLKKVKEIISVGYLPVDTEPVEGSKHLASSGALMGVAEDVEREVLQNQHIDDNTIRIELLDKDAVPSGAEFTYKKVKTKFLNVWDCSSDDVSWANKFRYFGHSFKVIGCGDLQDVTNVASLFAGSDVVSVEGLTLPSVTSIKKMFEGCTLLEHVEMTGLSSVTDCDEVFDGCISLKTVVLDDTSSMTRCENMFYSCKSMVDAPALDTSSLTDANSMFSSCTSLQTVPLYDFADVTTANYLFEGCEQLKEIPELDMGGCNHFISMFENCVSLEVVPAFDYSNAQRCSAMCKGCVNVKSGMSNAYTALSAVISSPSKYYNCFTDCGTNTEEGREERALVPTSWGGDLG